MSFCFPNINPSYQDFTSCFSCDIPIVSNAWNTSSSVNPKLDSYSSDVVVTTFKLFKSENTDSFDTLVMPVIIALSRYGLVLNVALKKFLIKAMNSSQYS